MFGMLHLPPWPWQNGSGQPSLKVRAEPPSPPRLWHKMSALPQRKLFPPSLSPSFSLLLVTRLLEQTESHHLFTAIFTQSATHTPIIHVVRKKMKITLWNIKTKHFKCWRCVNLSQKFRGGQQPWRSQCAAPPTTAANTINISLSTNWLGYKWCLFMSMEEDNTTSGSPSPLLLSRCLQPSSSPGLCRRARVFTRSSIV